MPARKGLPELLCEQCRIVPSGRSELTSRTKGKGHRVDNGSLEKGPNINMYLIGPQQ